MKSKAFPPSLGLVTVTELISMHTSAISTARELWELSKCPQTKTEITVYLDQLQETRDQLIERITGVKNTNKEREENV